MKDREPNPVASGWLMALNSRQEHIYAGTTPRAVVAKRRVKNKRARVARRVSRQSQ